MHALYFSSLGDGRQQRFLARLLVSVQAPSTAMGRQTGLTVALALKSRCRRQPERCEITYNREDAPEGSELEIDDDRRMFADHEAESRLTGQFWLPNARSQSARLTMVAKPRSHPDLDIVIMPCETTMRLNSSAACRPRKEAAFSWLIV